MTIPTHILAQPVVCAMLAGLCVLPASGAVLTVSDFGDSGQSGQLRTLLDQAQPGDLILVPAGTVTLAIPPTSPAENANQDGDLDLTKDVTIEGAGADVTIIDANGLDRVFDLQAGVTAALSGLAIRGGDATLERGAGVRALGPGSHLTLTNVEVTGNRAYMGGGLFVIETTLFLAGATIHDNESLVGGGGVLLGANPSALLVNVTISGNRTAALGGGLAIPDSVVDLVNVTVTGNRADTDDANGGEGGGIWVGGSSARVRLRDSIVAGNAVGVTGTAPDCLSGPPGALISLGPNLIADVTGCVVTGIVSGIISGLPPGLAPLADNGGPTLTHALLPDSPALNRGDAGCAPVDQRRVPRPQDGRCDLGAFEQRTRSSSRPDIP